MNDSTVSLRPENRAPERVTLPEVLREELVDEIVRRVLDHLDLFEDHLLLALDLVGRECRTKHDVGEQVDRERQMLVEHLDVVAGVFLRGERVELPADRIDRLRDVLGRAGRGALEEHVLDEVGDAAARLDLVARAARQPHADRHRPHVGHRLGDEPQPVVEYLADDHTLWSGRSSPDGAPRAATERRRKCLKMKGMNSSTGGPTGCAQRRAVQAIVHWMSFLRHAGTAMPDTDLRTDIAELDVPALEDALDALGRPRFHARQIFQWIHRHGVVDFDAMSDLSRELANAARRRVHDRDAGCRPAGTIRRRDRQIPAAARATEN